MDTQQATSTASKYANHVQVGPVTLSSSNGAIVAKKIEQGQVLYIGTNQQPNVISDTATYNALQNINIGQPLNDFSLLVYGPSVGEGTYISLSLSDLYSAMSDAASQNANLSEGVLVTFQVMDVVGNGKIGKMIVFGSNLLGYSTNTTQGGTVGT